MPRKRRRTGRIARGTPSRHSYPSLSSEYASIVEYVESQACAEQCPAEEYRPALQRMDYYTTWLESREVHIADLDPVTGGSEANKGFPYEEALFRRLTESRYSALALVGGLGTGKTTALQYVFRLIDTRRPQLADLNPCNCRPSCARTPLLADLRRLEPKNYRDGVLKTLHKLRYAVYNRSLNLAVGKRPTSTPEFSERTQVAKVLRRLFLVNDVFRNIDPSSVHLTAPPPEVMRPLRLDFPILSKQWSADELRALASRYADAAEDFDQKFPRFEKRPSASVALTTAVLRHYLDQCSAKSAFNLIAVDNIDHFPTETILKVVKHLRDVMEALPAGARLVISVRPSSLGRQGFPEHVELYFHYGPDCHHMMSHRLAQHVLNKFCLEKGANHRSLFIAGWLYFQVLQHAYSTDHPGIRDHQLGEVTLVPPDVPEGNEDTQRIDVSSESLQVAGDTLAAMVGTCARYATAQFRRFLWAMFHEPRLLPRIMEELETSGGRVRVRQGDLMLAVFGGKSRQPLANVGRVANLYASSRWKHRTPRPSLTSLRTLQAVADRERCYVDELLQDLALFGIPAEHVYAVLNELHNRNRGLLLWFSKNRDLQLRRKADLRQAVNISEHGVAYLSDVACNFDYISHCARTLWPQGRHRYSLRLFRHVLQDYLRVMGNVAEEEWEQECYLRLIGNVGPSKTSLFRSDDWFWSLHLFYGSLPRVLDSAIGSFSEGEVDSQNQRAVSRSLLQLFRTYEAGLKRQKLLRGTEGGRGISADAEACASAIEALEDLDVLGEEVSQGVELVYEAAGLREPPKHFVPPGLSNVDDRRSFGESSSDETALIEMYAADVRREGLALRQLLGTQVPSLETLQVHLATCCDAAEHFVEAAAGRALHFAETLPIVQRDLGHWKKERDELAALGRHREEVLDRSLKRPLLERDFRAMHELAKRVRAVCWREGTRLGVVVDHFDPRR